ncbi:MAG: SRPBCC domain-containing protein [Pseudomonadota bacterium]
MNAPTPEMTGETSLMMRRTFDADMPTLWAALTDPQAWLQWFGAQMATPQRTEADLRPGGKWAIEMQGNESGEPHNVRGEFVEIDEPNRVSFTWAWYSAPDAVSLVTYVLTDAGDGRTSLLLTHEKLPNADQRDGHGRGWMATLESLENYLSA